MPVEDEDLEQFTTDYFEHCVVHYSGSNSKKGYVSVSSDNWDNDICRGLIYYMRTGTLLEDDVSIYSYFQLEKLYRMYQLMPASIRPRALPYIEKYKKKLLPDPDNMIEQIEQKVFTSATCDDDEVDEYFRVYGHGSY